MWGDAVERRKALLTPHEPWPTDLRGAGVVCHQDGVRLSPKGEGWAHDRYEAARVLAAGITVDDVPGDLL